MTPGRARNRCSGQAALMITISLPVTLGLIGLVVDVGWAYYREEACRTAAQSAAFAAAMAANKAFKPDMRFGCYMHHRLFGLSVGPCQTTQHQSAEWLPVRAAERLHGWRNERTAER